MCLSTFSLSEYLTPVCVTTLNYRSSTTEPGPPSSPLRRHGNNYSSPVLWRFQVKTTSAVTTVDRLKLPLWVFPSSAKLRPQNGDERSMPQPRKFLLSRARNGNPSALNLSPLSGVSLLIPFKPRLPSRFSITLGDGTPHSPFLNVFSVVAKHNLRFYSKLSLSSSGTRFVELR